MQAISGLWGNSSTLYPAEKTTTSFSSLTRFFPGGHSALHESPSRWQGVKAQALQMKDLLPDLFTVAESGLTISREVFGVLPTAMRAGLVSVGILNLTLIPDFVNELRKLIPDVLSKIHRGVAIDKSLSITYMVSLTAAMVAIATLGVRELCHMLEVSPQSLRHILDWILPWLSYGLRAFTIVQLMDVVTGNRFQREIEYTLSPQARRPDWMSPTNSFLAKALYIPASPVLLTFQSAIDSYRSAKDSLTVMRSRRRYLSRSNGYAHGLSKTFKKLDSKLDSWWYNPISAMLAARETNRLARDMHARSVSYVRNQVFGIGANIFAGFGMIATNTLAVAVFGIGSASFYMSQSVHRWNMVPSLRL